VAIRIDSPVPFPAGDQGLALLAVTVADAATALTELLSLAITAIDDVAQAAPERAGLRVLGAVAADPARSGQHVLRLVGGAESGAALWRAPRLPVPAPGLPISLATRTTTAGVTAPERLAGRAGGLVSLPVRLAGEGALSAARLTLRFDPRALSLAAVRADPGSGLAITVETAAEGLVAVAVRHAAGGAIDGLLALFDLLPEAGLAAGTEIALSLAAETTGGAPAGAVAGPAAAMLRLDLPVPGEDPAAPANPTRAARARLLGGEAA
jgi:hypothetical protein